MKERKSRLSRMIESSTQGASLVGAFDECLEVHEGDSETNRKVAHQIVSKNRVNGPYGARRLSYYKSYKGETVKVRFSCHLPMYEHIVRYDAGVEVLILILTDAHLKDSTITAHIKTLHENATKDGRTDLPKEYPYVVVGETPDSNMILKARRKIGDYIDVSPSASAEELRKKVFEAVLKLDKLNQFTGQSSIPDVGFIKPDGSFIDIKKYGFNSHIKFASAVSEFLWEFDYSDMLKFAEQGYIRFANDVDEVILQSSSYPTRQQFVTIRRCVDYIGTGIFEVFKNGVPAGHIVLTRDTLDADMRKLEALLNKVKPPQPKTKP